MDRRRIFQTSPLRRRNLRRPTMNTAPRKFTHREVGDRRRDDGRARRFQGCPQLAIASARAVRTARSRRGTVPLTHLAREGRMTVTIGRREVLAALGGAAGAWTLAAKGQQPAERM